MFFMVLDNFYYKGLSDQSTDMSISSGQSNMSHVWHTADDINKDKHLEEFDPQYDVEALDELNGPRSWLHPAIASAVFCFFPTGILAVLQARKAMKAYDSGDLHSWVRYTSRARFLVFLTCFMGLIVYGAIIGIIHAIKHTGDS